MAGLADDRRLCRRGEPEGAPCRWRQDRPGTALQR
jgi:hypothetical protein